jgi:hypothetical protein
LTNQLSSETEPEPETETDPDPHPPVSLSLVDPLLSIPLTRATDVSQSNDSDLEHMDNDIENIIDNMQFNDPLSNSEFLETTIVSSDNSQNVMRINYYTTPFEYEQTQTDYYSLFDFQEFNIRYNHDHLISPTDADFVIQQILSNIFEQNAMNQSFNELQNQMSHENSDDMKRQINQHIVKDQYVNLKHLMKNEVCPISLEQFEHDSDICMFDTCNHGFCSSYEEKFLKLFNKCPLCNGSLLVPHQNQI